MNKTGERQQPHCDKIKISAEGHPLVFNERGNSHTKGQAASYQFIKGTIVEQH